MVFSSPIFLFLFLPSVLLLHFLAGRRLRNAVLLLASLAFYTWGEVEWAGVMLVSILANFAFAHWVARERTRGRGRLAVGVAVAFDLALLGFYKYAVWFWANGVALCAALGVSSSWLGQRPDIHLPLGISFFTFHALSAVVDIYRDKVKPTRNVLDFALYISFFAQLIAGPIVRYHDIEDQIRARRVTFEGFAYGVRRFVIGLGKKALVANTVAMAVDQAFAVPAAQLSFAAAWLAVFGYALQIYFDFSGYSDMAIGLARMFGFTFRENFEQPYLARSITDFWRRWHISLSTWFRDYLYIPLGGNRRGKARTYVNLATVFLLTGLWHGAAWTFVAWGLWHGALLVIERVGVGAWLERRPAALRHGYTMLAVLLGWAIFRAENLGYARELFVVLFDPLGHASALYPAPLFLDNERTLAFAAGALCLLPWSAWFARLRARSSSRALESALEIASAASLTLVFLAALLAVSAGTYNPFIYFRF